MATKILLIEDQNDVARTLRRALAVHGYDLRVVRSCSEARRLCRSLQPTVSRDEAREQSIKKKSFDCAVADIDLPDGSGIDLAEQLLEHCIAGVIFFSGTGDVQSLIRARAVGPVVRKSQGFELLLTELVGALNKTAVLQPHTPATDRVSNAVHDGSAAPESAVATSGVREKSGERPIDPRAKEAAKTRLSGEKG